MISIEDLEDLAFGALAIKPEEMKLDAEPFIPPLSAQGLSYDEVQRVIRDLDTQEQIDAFLATWSPPEPDPIMPALLQAEASEDDLGEAIIGLAISGAILLAIAVTGRYSVLQLAIPDDWQNQPGWARRSRAMAGIASAERVTVDPDQLAARRAAIDDHYRGITRGHGQALTDGVIDLPEYQRRMVGSITEAHTVQRRLGQGPLGMAGRQSLQDTLQLQLGYFEEFLGGIAKGELSAAQIVDRSGRYGANGGLSFNQGMDEATKAMAATEQRLLGNCTPHCRECVAYAGRGVVPVGTLPLPRMACSCRDRCCCILTRFDLSGAVVGWIG